jgi:hypothetical protein
MSVPNMILNIARNVQGPVKLAHRNAGICKAVSV